MLVGVRRAVATFLTAIWVAAFPQTDLSAVKRTAFTTFTLPVEPARRAADFWKPGQKRHVLPIYNFAMFPIIKVNTKQSPPENMDLPRQTWVLQVLLCRLRLLQGGKLQMRVRCCCPPPQLTEHMDHCDQGSHGPTESGRQIIYHSISVVTLVWCSSKQDIPDGFFHQNNATPIHDVCVIM